MKVAEPLALGGLLLAGLLGCNEAATAPARGPTNQDRRSPESEPSTPTLPPTSRVDGANAAARERRTFDRTGAPAGRVDAEGRFYDHTGAPAGRVDERGNYFDRTGAPAGRADADGRFYDRTGAPSGRIDADGRIYDRTGAAAGRVDADGRVYDRTGAPAGRVDGACDEACKRDAAKRLLEGKP